MGITQVTAQTHIQTWQTHLANTNRPHRQTWPSRLFRHEPLENAVGMLRSGQLLSRNSAAGQIQRDIAPPNIIAHRGFAKDYVRLYFRPKTPTQYHIEGIRKPIDYYQGKHAPILIIFIFQSGNLLVDPDAMFSDGNMQSHNTNWGDDDAFFQSINFNHVYHEGSFNPTIPGNRDIIRVRCAEVLMSSPLNLNGTLQAVLCRSPAERTTLIHLLGGAAANWQNRIRVHSVPGIFNNEYVYIDKVSVTNEGIIFSFHPPLMYQSVKTEIQVQGIDNGLALGLGPWQLDPRKNWIHKQQFNDGIYEAKILVEDCLAFQSRFTIDSLPF